MILVDTTVWIDFFANRDTKQVEILSRLIEQNEELCISGIVLTEILQGIKHQKEYKQVESLLNSLVFLEMTKDMFHLSARIYRFLRARGITVRKTLDCMIASTAIKHKAALLHNDKDFNSIQKYFSLRVVN